MRSATAAVLLAALLGGCGGVAQQSGSGGYAVVVRSGTRTAGHFDVAALRQLPQVDVSTPKSQGKQVQRGPLVRTVLTRAGVTQFSRLRVVGLDASSTFTSGEIDQQVVLDFDNRGTVKLAGANLAQNRWIRDVRELDADP